MAKLGDVCEVLNGFAFKSDQYVESGIRIIRIANVQKGYIEDSSPAFCPMDSIEAKKYQLKENDLLMSLTGNVGRVGLLTSNFLPAALNQRVACLRIKDSSTFEKAYLFHVLNSDFFEQKCIESANGVAQKNMSTEWLKEYEIPLPPLDEQLRIAAVLDKVSGLIAKRREQLDKLDELVKARFVEMFGDPIKNEKGFPTITGQDFFKLSNGKFVPENKRFDNGVPAYGGNGISWYTDEILYHNDTIVVGRVGFQSGNVHLAKGPLWVTDNAMYISDYQSNKYNLLFLYALIEHINFTRFQDAGDLKKITQKPFMNMEYIMPTLAQQQEYVSFSMQTEKSKLTIQQSLDKLEVLKKALMQQYFG